jgi:hypothetical protein
MVYTALTAKELRNRAGTLLQKVASEHALIAAELASILAGTGMVLISQVVADGETIAHTLGDVPTCVLLTGTVPGETLSWAADATNVTVSIKTNLLEPGTTQTVTMLAKL